MNNYDVAQKSVEATENLQNARRELKTLQAEEEKYLKDREAKAQALLADKHQEIKSASSLLSKITDKIVTKTKEYREKFQKFAQGLFSTLDRVDTLVESARDLHEKAEKTLQIVTDKYKDLQKFEKELGRFDRELTKRESDVNKRNKEADEKLSEAERLADWANSGETYKITRKK